MLPLVLPSSAESGVKGFVRPSWFWVCRPPWVNRIWLCVYYGDLITIYPKPHSIYSGGTIGGEALGLGFRVSFGSA